MPVCETPTCDNIVKNENFKICWPCSKKKREAYTKRCQLNAICNGDKIPDDKEYCSKCYYYNEGLKLTNSKECGFNGCLIKVDPQFETCILCKSAYQKAQEKRENLKRKLEDNNLPAAKRDKPSIETLDQIDYLTSVVEKNTQAIRDLQEQIDMLTVVSDHVKTV